MRPIAQILFAQKLMFYPGRNKIVERFLRPRKLLEEIAANRQGGLQLLKLLGEKKIENQIKFDRIRGENLVSSLDFKGHRRPCDMYG